MSRWPTSWSRPSAPISPAPTPGAPVGRSAFIRAASRRMAARSADHEVAAGADQAVIDAVALARGPADVEVARAGIGDAAARHQAGTRLRGRGPR